jgi:hypothetical protein
METNGMDITTYHRNNTRVGGYDEREQDYDTVLMELEQLHIPVDSIITQTPPNTPAISPRNSFYSANQKPYSIETVIIKNKLSIPLIAIIQGSGSTYKEGIFYTDYYFSPEPITIAPFGINYFQRNVMRYNKKNQSIMHILDNNTLLVRSKKLSRRSPYGDPATQIYIDSPFTIDNNQGLWTTIVVEQAYQNVKNSMKFTMIRTP